MGKRFLMIALIITGGFYACNQQSSNTMPENSTADTFVLKEKEGRASNKVAASNDANDDTDLSPSEWNGVDYNTPSALLPEITVKGIETRGNEKYTGYSMDETVLFDSGKAELRSMAKESLQQVAASINKRSKGKIRIYGYTDSVDNTENNKKLSEQRAQAVKQWLVQEGSIDESRISIHPIGESRPEATNKTEAGRQQNRRIEIVALRNE